MQKNLLEFFLCYTTNHNHAALIDKYDIYSR